LIKIYYFSGTGNSLWSAKKIARLSGESFDLYNIGIEAEKEEIFIEAGKVILVYPSYAYGLPLIVRRFAQKAVFNTPYLAAFVTYGSDPGGTQAELQRILKNKKIESLYFGKIPAPENYIPFFGPPNDKKTAKRTAMQEEATEKAARYVIETRTNKVNPFRPLSSFISFLFSLGVKIFYKHYKVSGACNGCGVCERVCPAGAVKMAGNRPVFSDKCENCVACIDICPLRAIQFGRAKFGTRGYCHSGIGIKELGRG